MVISKFYSLVKDIFSEDFVIDEKSVEVWRENGAGSESETFPKEEQDLVALMTQIIQDNQKLIYKTQELERAGQRDDDLEKFFRRFLPVLDSFDRILFQGREADIDEANRNWLKTVETIYFRLKDICEHYGLIELKCLGKTVDLNYHEVVEMRYSKDHPANVIIAERQKGYIFRGKVLRDAQVVVSTHEKR